MKRLLPYACLSALLLFGCGDNNAEKPKQEKPEHFVETAAVVSKDLGVIRNRTGTLKPGTIVKVKTREEGMIVALPFSEGDTVQKGDVVIQLDDALIKAQLDRATITRKQALLDLKRIRELRKKNILSEDELTQSITALEVAKADEALLQTRLGYTTVTSPINGTVLERLSEPGNIVNKYDHVLTIADPTSLHTELTVSELLVPHLSLNDPAKVTIDALGRQTFSGKVSRIYPGLDPITRRGTIEVTLDPVPEGARPGQLCRVELETRAAARQVIPFSALRRDSKGEYVYRVTNENVAERVAVQSGLRLAELVEILKGLEDGDLVVIRGFLGLKDGKKVTPVTAEE